MENAQTENLHQTDGKDHIKIDPEKQKAYEGVADIGSTNIVGAGVNTLNAETVNLTNTRIIVEEMSTQTQPSVMNVDEVVNDKTEKPAEEVTASTLPTNEHSQEDWINAENRTKQISQMIANENVSDKTAKPAKEVAASTTPIDEHIQEESINAENSTEQISVMIVEQNVSDKSEKPAEEVAASTIPTEEHSQEESINAKANVPDFGVNEVPIILSNIVLAKAQPAPDVATKAPSKTGGLGLLAQYYSDGDDSSEAKGASDTDSVVEVPISSNIGYRSKVVEIDSDSESSDSTSSSSSSDTDSEGEYLTQLRKEIDKRIQTVDDDDDDDEDDDYGQRPRRRQPPKVRGELTLDELPPIQNLEITVPEEECVELGRIQSIVDQLVLVTVLPNSLLLDLDTVLFLEKGRKVLGEVFDVLGQVADPMYCIRFNSSKQITERGINIGDIVYCAPKTEHTQFVILSKLTQIRGSDASWEHDVEPPPRYLDYSDDEEEREARAQLRNKNRPYEHNDPTKRTRADTSNDTNNDSSTDQTDRIAAQPARQRGRRYAREHSNPNGNMQHNSSGGGECRSHSRDQRYNFHPSYNSGSWHSNYYHNYHPSAVNFNIPPPPPPMGAYPPHAYAGYGSIPPPPPYGMYPYGMRSPLLPPHPPHIYPASYPSHSPDHPPPSSNN